MIKNGVEKKYLLPEYRCTVQGDIEDGRIASAEFYRCNEVVPCPEGNSSGGNE